MSNINTNFVEEIDKAIGIMRKLTAKATGTNWYTVYQEEPEDTVLVGIEAESEEFTEFILEGAFMGGTGGGGGVCDEDAEFITMMDPDMANFVITLLESVRDQDFRQADNYHLHGRSAAQRIARHINNKFGKEQYGVPTSRRR